MLSSPSPTTVTDRITLSDPADGSSDPILELQAEVAQARIQTWQVFCAAAFLVSVPVFVESPLVRYWPWVSLVASLGWAGLSIQLCRQKQTQLWGELLVGFTWTWLCGALFWGWLRWEPTWHLPVEALALPIALWGARRRWAIVGQYFYLGSLLGTIVTDVYFYLANLMPAWRQLMRAEPDAATAVFQAALAQIYTPWGIGCAIGLSTLLLGCGIYSLKQKYLYWVAFSGAVLSTILVDGLFWLAAAFA